MQIIQPAIGVFIRYGMIPGFLFGIVTASQTIHALTVTDDQGTSVTIPEPVTRVISLAPHLAELLFAAGGGHTLIGTVRYSDFPEQVKDLPVVGDANRLDLEKIITLQPDLVIAWGTFAGTDIEQLRELGLQVYVSASDTLANVAHTLLQLGTLTGTTRQARLAHDAFLDDLAVLRNRYTDRHPVRVFYQFWHDPIYTINNSHLIAEVIRLCGGDNVFADMTTMSGTVTLEAVIHAMPSVIIASGADANPPRWLQAWQEWPALQAVADRHIYNIPPDLIQRPSVRIAEGARLMCEFIDNAR